MCEALDAAHAPGHCSDQVASGLPAIQLPWSRPSTVPGADSVLQNAWTVFTGPACGLYPPDLWWETTHNCPHNKPPS